LKARRPRMRFPRRISDLLGEGLQGLPLGERLREMDIWLLWPEVVGTVVASRAQPLRIINGVLTVVVSSGPWLQELSFLKGMMRDKLNARLGGEIVREIVLRSGPVARTGNARRDGSPPRRKLTDREMAFIAEQAAAIADPETREAFAALMKSSLESGPPDAASGGP